MNCLPIFYEEEFKKNFQITSRGESEENMCVICYERKSDVILKCFVRNSFI